MSDQIDCEIEAPKDGKVAKYTRGALQAIGGAIPFAGGVFSAIAGAWSEGEQEKFNRFFELNQVVVYRLNNNNGTANMIGVKQV